MAQEKVLTPEEVAALRELARPGLSKQTIPEKIRDRLIKLGFIEQKLDGLVATPKGKAYLLPRQKK
jgi:hypothetical protein